MFCITWAELRLRWKRRTQACIVRSLSKPKPEPNATSKLLLSHTHLSGSALQNLNPRTPSTKPQTQIESRDGQMVMNCLSTSSFMLIPTHHQMRIQTLNLIAKTPCPAQCRCWRPCLSQTHCPLPSHRLLSFPNRFLRPALHDFHLLLRTL